MIFRARTQCARAPHRAGFAHSKPLALSAGRDRRIVPATAHPDGCASMYAGRDAVAYAVDGQAMLRLIRADRGFGSWPEPSINWANVVPAPLKLDLNLVDYVSTPLEWMSAHLETGSPRARQAYRH